MNHFLNHLIAQVMIAFVTLSISTAETQLSISLVNDVLVNVKSLTIENVTSGKITHTYTDNKSVPLDPNKAPLLTFAKDDFDQETANLWQRFEITINFYKTPTISRIFSLRYWETNKTKRFLFVNPNRPDFANGAGPRVYDRLSTSIKGHSSRANGDDKKQYLANTYCYKGLIDAKKRQARNLAAIALECVVKTSYAINFAKNPLTKFVHHPNPSFIDEVSDFFNYAKSEYLPQKKAKIEAQILVLRIAPWRHLKGISNLETAQKCALKDSFFEDLDNLNTNHRETVQKALTKEKTFFRHFFGDLKWEKEDLGISAFFTECPLYST